MSPRSLCEGFASCRPSPSQCWAFWSTMPYHVRPQPFKPPLCLPTAHTLLTALHPSKSYLLFKPQHCPNTCPDPSSLYHHLGKSHSTISSTSQTAHDYLTTWLLFYCMLSHLPQSESRFSEDKGYAFLFFFFFPFHFPIEAHRICCPHSMLSQWRLMDSCA